MNKDKEFDNGKAEGKTISGEKKASTGSERRNLQKKLIAKMEEGKQLAQIIALKNSDLSKLPIHQAAPLMRVLSVLERWELEEMLKDAEEEMAHICSEISKLRSTQ